MSIEKYYTADLSKGQGLVEETSALLDLWEPGMSVQDLKDQALSSGVLGRATALRANDIVGRIFATRFLEEDGRAAGQLKLAKELGASDSTLLPLYFLYACRGHAALRDFVSEVYWGKVMAGSDVITREDALSFIEQAGHLGRISPPWSESTVTRMGRYLSTALADFGLAAKDRSGKREILPYDLPAFCALYLAYDLHFAGFGDKGVLEHEDWRLFGLELQDVRRLLDRVGHGHMLIQYSEDVVSISWQHETMEDALRAITATEL